MSLLTQAQDRAPLPLDGITIQDGIALVIQRFGDVKLLVNQTLDPMVGAYFKNIGQQKTLIELIQSRSEIQEHSSQDMKAKYAAMAKSENRVAVDLLALSGGADDGAFGAGLLVGWSEKGDRPEFALVTGVSAGSLIAPFIRRQGVRPATRSRLCRTRSTPA